MEFDVVLAQVAELLRREGRVSYRALKRRFALDDDFVEDLKAELIDAKRLAVDEDGKVLVWSGTTPVSGSTFQADIESAFGVQSSNQLSIPPSTWPSGSGPSKQH